MPVPGGALTLRRLDKAALRQAAEGARRDLSVEVRAAGDVARSAALAPLLEGRRVASYVPFGTEPVPPVLAGAVVPVLLPDRDLSWQLPGGPDLGVDAVAACDVVLVPALRVDRDGVRLGRGGGSYDRALLRATGLVVALLHDGELSDDPLPGEPHDVRVHAVALPSGVVGVSARIGP